VHLVLLPTIAHHVPNVDESPAITSADLILAQRNAGPRVNRNLLVFCAPSEARLQELRTATRQHLAWASVIADHEAQRLELTKGDVAQARSKVAETSETVTQRIAETYQHVLVPEQTPGTREIRWHQTKPSGTGSLAERIAKKLESEERLITAYGGTRVRMDLDRVPLWTERQDIGVDALWKAYCQFPYLPRLARFEVLANAIGDGVSKLTWSVETFAYADAHDGTRWVGLTTTQHIAPRPGGLVVHPDAARQQLDAERTAADEADGGVRETSGSDSSPGGAVAATATGARPVADPKSFYGQFELDSVRAIRQLEDILRNIVEHLSAAPRANVKLTLEINASAEGFDDRVRRVVNENAGQLGAKSKEFE
jgi:hypothetical protein